MNFSLENDVDIVNDVSCFKFDPQSFGAIKIKIMENYSSHARNTTNYAKQPQI